MSDFKRPPDGVCFFKNLENTLCEHEGWFRKKGPGGTLGNWNSGVGQRRTLVNPAGDVTEDGFFVVDNTGLLSKTSSTLTRQVPVFDLDALIRMSFLDL